MKKNIGKNTLGDGGKMSVQLKKFARSTHDLSYAWRNTQGIGTLVPFMHILGLPGDTFDIDLEAEVMTHPTVGPLFGSFKLQVDVFECPIRLYQAQLHNNALNIGLKMSNVKFPKLRMQVGSTLTKNLISNSSILSYLGLRGLGYKQVGRDGNTNTPIDVNGLKLLSYLDIFKNYYANKQEENYYYIANPVLTGFGQIGQKLPLSLNSNEQVTASFSNNVEGVRIEFHVVDSISPSNDIITLVYGIENPYIKWGTASGKNVNLTTIKAITIRDIKTFGAILQFDKLENLDRIRETILKQNVWHSTDLYKGTCKYIDDITYNNAAVRAEAYGMISTTQGGLLVKTHQSDLFNNWVNSEWVDGDNGINAITAIDTSSGSFNLDTLNLAKKVYNMLNRIAVSGGTYNDWIETVYTNDYVQRSEIPVYIGGMSKRIEFGQVVSTAGTEDEPLASLAGRGYTDGKKGGRMKFKCAEPCYVIGIVSITPYVDYYQGNSFDWNLDNMDELHKPQLDGIGWQDLTTDIMNIHAMQWKNNLPDIKSIGKTIAWANYMTAVNEVHGNFCENEKFMVLTREYGEKADGGIEGASTYIDPADYNYIFADPSRDSMNFWVQIGCGVTARRKMSAKQIPIM